MKKRPVGRPSIPARQRRSYLVNVRITPDERKKFELIAKREGITLSEVLMKPWRGE